MRSTSETEARRRIAVELSSLGYREITSFGTGLVTRSGMEFSTYIRRSGENLCCFEEIDIEDYGKGISIWVYTTFLPGCTGSTLTRKGQAVDFSDGMSWRNVAQQTRKGKAWLEKLREVADTKSREETEKHGDPLLDKFRRARKAAKFYLQYVEQPIVGFRDAFDRLAAVSTEDELQAGHKGLAPTYLTVLTQEEDAEEEAIALYKFITLTIARNPQGAEQGFFPFGTTPEGDRDLDPCVRVMASVLFQEPGSEHICFD